MVSWFHPHSPAPTQTPFAKALIMVLFSLGCSASCLCSPTESLTCSTFKYITNTATTHQLHCSLPTEPTFSLGGCENNLQNGRLPHIAPLYILERVTSQNLNMIIHFLPSEPGLVSHYSKKTNKQKKPPIFLPIPFSCK